LTFAILYCNLTPGQATELAPETLEVLMAMLEWAGKIEVKNTR